MAWKQSSQVDGRKQTGRRYRPKLELLEGRILLNGDPVWLNPPATLGTVVAVSAPMHQDGFLGNSGTMDWYQLNASGGMLKVDLAPEASSLGLRLILVGADGHLLATSEGTPSDPLGAHLEQYIVAEPYYLGVSGQGATSYHLVTQLDAAVSPIVPLASGQNPLAVMDADVNDDGRVDLISANGGDNSLSLWLGNGDGTFQPRLDFFVGQEPSAVLAVDLDNNGRLDLVSANRGTNTLSVILQNLDGSFQPRFDLTVGQGPCSLAADDLNHDNLPDLVVANRGPTSDPDSSLTVLLGNGSGTFLPPQTITVGFEPVWVAIADATADGELDVVCANYQSATLSILAGAGDGTFDARPAVLVGNGPTSVTAADVNNDTVLDLVGTNSADNTLSIVRGNGSGGFLAQTTLATGPSATATAVADLNDDGLADLVVASRGPTLDVLRGKDDGTFEAPRKYAVGAGASAVRIVDVNMDDRLDIICAAGDRQLHVLLQNEDGSFLMQADFVLHGDGNASFVGETRFITGLDPLSVATADVNLDGQLDLVATAAGLDGVSVLLGDGFGNFGPHHVFATGQKPDSVVVADVNRDSRPDVITANRIDGTLSVLIGNGDGTFQPHRDYAVGSGPQAVVVVDINGDDRLDLISANSESSTLSVWRGRGDGTFHSRSDYQVGAGSFAVVAADLNNDGRTDLVSANRAAGTLSILRRNPNGTFIRHDVSVGTSPVAVAVADFNHDNRPDLVSGDLGGTLIVLLGRPDGGFDELPAIAGGPQPFALVTIDINGDKLPDLVSADNGDDALRVRLGIGDGTFQDAQVLRVGKGPIWVVAGDFNRDGRPDLVSANSRDSTLSVYLGAGGADSISYSGGVDRNSPELVDLNGDGCLDSVILDGFGNILYRQGQPGDERAFAPPRVLNPDRPAVDIASVCTGAGWAVAAIDRDPTASSTDGAVYTVSLYALDQSGEVVCNSDVLRTSSLPTSLSAGVLDGSGRDALILAHALENTVSLALPGANPGTFGPLLLRKTGVTPTELCLADLNGDQQVDVLVGAAVSGDVTVLYNDATHSFTDLARFRTGTGFYGLDPSGTGTVYSLQQPVAVVASDFVPGGGADVVVLLQGTHELIVLENNGRGGLANLDPNRRSPTTHNQVAMAAPGPMVSADFNNDDVPDLAILQRDRGEVWIFEGQADGRFRWLSFVAAGIAPTGLASVYNDRTEQTDLLVGNELGDVLFLLGNGNGTFRAPVFQPGQSVPFAVRDFNKDGIQDVLLASELDSLAEVQLRTLDASEPFATPDTVFSQTGGNLKFPTGVVLAKMDEDQIDDMILPNSGNNSVDVYKGLGSGKFRFLASFAVGTRPSNVLAADLNNDTLMDLAVTNQGSNDVSILFGQGTGPAWTMSYGPRLAVGIGPTSVSLRQATGDRVLDLVVTNSTGGSKGDMTVLPGIGTGVAGTGFFRDNNSIAIDVLGEVIGPPVGSRVITNLGILQGSFSTGRFNSIFASTQVTAFTNFGDSIVAGFDDGSLRLLTDANGDGKFAESQIFRNAELTDPSALLIVNNNGRAEIYATTSGLSSVFVFGLEVGIPVGTRGQQANVTPLGLVLLASLVTSAEGDALVESGGDLSFVFGLGNPSNEATLALFTSLLAGSDGVLGEDIVYEREEEQFSLNDLVIGVESGLRLVREQLGSGASGAGDMRAAFDQVFTGLGRVSETVEGMWQEAVRCGGTALQNSDSGIGKLMPQFGVSGMEPMVDGLHAVILSIWRVVREAGLSLTAPSLWWPLQPALVPGATVESTSAAGAGWEGLITVPDEQPATGWSVSHWSLISDDIWKQALGAVMIAGIRQFDPFRGALRQRGDRSRSLPVASVRDSK